MRVELQSECEHKSHRKLRRQPSDLVYRPAESTVQAPRRMHAGWVQLALCTALLRFLSQEESKRGFQSLIESF